MCSCTTHTHTHTNIHTRSHLGLHTHQLDPHLLSLCQRCWQSCHKRQHVLWIFHVFTIAGESCVQVRFWSEDQHQSQAAFSLIKYKMEVDVITIGSAHPNHFYVWEAVRQRLVTYYFYWFILLVTLLYFSLRMSRTRSRWSMGKCYSSQQREPTRPCLL